MVISTSQTTLRAQIQTLDLRSAIDTVKSCTDLRQYLKARLIPYREFDGYWQSRCLSPTHDDHQASLLVFPDRCQCRACSFSADIIDFYRAENPSASVYDALCAIADNPAITYNGAPVKKSLRILDAERALKYHFDTSTHPFIVDHLQQMGFTRQAIQHFTLGIATVPVRIADTKEYEQQQRISIPVWAPTGELLQIIYRKLHTADQGSKITMEYGAGGKWLFNAIAAGKTDYLVLTGGWGDVITLWQMDIPAVCSISGDGTFSQEWLPILQHTKRLYIIPDTDQCGLLMAQRVQAAIPWAKTILIPRGKDVREWALLGGTGDELRLLIRKSDSLKRIHATKRY